ESSDPGARVLRAGFASSLEGAAFANTVAARYLDYNDTYQGVGTGHPSDMIPGLLSVAEAYGRSGTDLLVAVTAGYEAFGAIAKEVPIRDKGFDQGVLIGLGAAAGAAKLMGLTEEQTREAIGLVVTMCAPTRSTRSGRLLMWKGAATAAAVKLGIFAARLASAGMTGPDEPIEGRHGLWEQVTGPFRVHPFGGDEPWIVSTTSIKYLPFESNAHGPVDLAFDLLKEIGSYEDITAIKVATYWNSWHDIGSEPEKWNPDTRETADHSLPFILAVALVDGKITKDSFDDTHIADPRIRKVMATITVEENKEYSAAWPDEVRTSLDVTTTDGRQRFLEVAHPKGHPRNRGTAADIEAKFLVNTGEPLGSERAGALVHRLRDLRALSAVQIVDLFQP
ncbi:MAG TPA: MmgE/PrpD family protein, partial [Rugosimonospora sp.]|nr:MmgE/PrpD family protein [Rugosimonospora sp.]